MEINNLIIELNRTLFEFEYDSTNSIIPIVNTFTLKNKFKILNDILIVDIVVIDDYSFEITFKNNLKHKLDYYILDIMKQGGF
ncbi:MAG TPA: hypothetical protein EYG89_04750 [Bacteroidia bacterium]|nr:hypothetical protein [Bacteroidia bacterium]